MRHRGRRMHEASGKSDVTMLLEAVGSGSPQAADRLFPIVYGELRRLAQSILRGERPGHTLQATALVHEAYVKLVGQDSLGIRGRAEFFAVAAQAMRRILVDHARVRNSQKRGGGGAAMSLSDGVDSAIRDYQDRAVDLEALDNALTRLAAMDGRKARLVELRFFGGLTLTDAADMLGLSVRSAEREWSAARAWLRAAMEERR